MQNKKTKGVGILSWKSHQTLISTLNSYEEGQLTSFFDEKIIWFNERTEEDDKIAKKYGYTPFGDERNLCFVAEENIAQSLNTDYIVILQNDCPLYVQDKKEIKEQLDFAENLLKTGQADIVRLRHRYQVGESFSDVKKYLKYYNVQKISKRFITQAHPICEKDLKYNPLKFFKRLIRPSKAKKLLGRSVFIEDNPALLFPKYIKKIDDTFIVDSCCINYSEQPFMMKRDFFLNVICKYINEHPSSRTLNGFQVPEIILNNDWWRNQHFKIAVPTGIFTHGRVDGYRENKVQYVQIKGK